MVKILYLEDDLKDTELVTAQIAAAGIACAVERVETRAGFLEALSRENFALILSDFSLPLFDGLSALQLARERCPETPFIFVSSTLGAEAAVEALKQGATDYVLKDRLPRRLVSAVERALSEAAESRAREHVEQTLRQQEARVYQLAFYDSLTGLPNRALFEDRLALALVQARRAGHGAALLFVDIDRFKSVNDSLGHAVGDRLLQHVAQRIAACLRESDTAARWAGDEFVVLLPDLGDDQRGVAQAALLVAEKIRYALAEPMLIEENQELHASGSLGIALFPWDAETATDLIRGADTAMYHAKNQGRNASEFYTPEMNLAIRQRLSLEGELRHAVAHGELVLEYQPQVDAASGRWIGAEALLRWEHPRRGRILPSLFVPLAEESRQIVAIGGWVLHAALEQVRAWRAAGLDPPRLAINVSQLELKQPDFTERVEAALSGAGLPSLVLEIELTESVFMGEDEDLHARLRKLRDLGVSLCIDDFGTGYSSLGYLKRWPIEVLKIDQSFLREVSTNQEDRAIVQAILALAKALKINVVAEGVETLAQLTFLQRSGCQLCQGYYFGPPMSAARFTERLTHRQKGEVPLSL